MEDILDRQYQEYMIKTKTRAQKKREAGQVSDDDDEDFPKTKKITTKIKGFEPKVSGNIISSDEENSDLDDEDLKDIPQPVRPKGNELLVEDDEDEEKVPSSKRASMWFSQFKALDEDADEDMEIQKMKKKLLQTANNNKRARDAEKEEDEDSEDEEYRKKKEQKVKLFNVETESL
jgi:hypothetical protein